MIAALIVWSYLGVVLYLYGASAVSLLDRWLGDSEERARSLPVLLLVGLTVFGTLAAFVSVLIPLSLAAAVLLAAGALLLFIIVRPRWHWTLRRPDAAQWLAALVMLLAFLIVWANSTDVASNPDTNLYHAQTIHWVESFRAVPGLGNLNGRLAYNSDWLVLNAATSFAFLGLGSFHLVAGLLFLIAALYFMEGLSGLAQRPTRLSSWLKVLFLPLAFRTLVGEISSPGTDLPVILLTWMLVALASEYFEAESERGRDAPLSASSGSPVSALLLLGVLPAFMVTLKLSAAPLMLLSLYAFVALLGAGERRAAWTQAGLSIVVLLPWLIRSVVLSGYLVFPYSQLDLFAFDWKIPAAYVDAVRNGVIGWARLPDKDWTEAVNLPLRVWLPAWFGEQTLNQRLMIVAALISPLILAWRAMRRHAVLVLINYAGALFWIFTAPNLRFGYSFLLAAVAFIGGALLAWLVGRLPGPQLRGVPWVTGGLLAALLILTLVSSVGVESLSSRLLLPADYRDFHAEACPVGSLQVYCATAYKQCGYEPFPCVPNAPARLRPRGAGLQDGFYSVGK